MARHGRLARSTLFVLGCVVPIGASEPCEKTAQLWVISGPYPEELVPANYTFAFDFQDGGSIVCEVDVYDEGEPTWECDHELMSMETFGRELYFNFDGWYPAGELSVSVWRDEEILLSDYVVQGSAVQLGIREPGPCEKDPCYSSQSGLIPLDPDDG